jgi:hypothetical protein
MGVRDDRRFPADPPLETLCTAYARNGGVEPELFPQLGARFPGLPRFKLKGQRSPPYFGGSVRGN